MKSFRLTIFSVALALIACLQACSTGGVNVVPVPLSAHLEALYIVDGGDEWPPEFLPAVVRKVSAMGFIPVVVTSQEEVPEGGASLSAAMRLSRGTIPSYTYIRFDIRRDGRLLGYATGDSGEGLHAMGTASDRIEPLLERLLALAGSVTPRDSKSK
ncbi:MAG TPA: hypothetical protein PKI32_01075 [Opitutales bacterium]|nr:hypothetical protein [Opitutales bacterium]